MQVQLNLIKNNLVLVNNLVFYNNNSYVYVYVF